MSKQSLHSNLIVLVADDAIHAQCCETTSFLWDICSLIIGRMFPIQDLVEDHFKPHNIALMLLLSHLAAVFVQQLVAE